MKLETMVLTVISPAGTEEALKGIVIKIIGASPAVAAVSPADSVGMEVEIAEVGEGAGEGVEVVGVGVVATADGDGVRVGVAERNPDVPLKPDRC